MKREFLQNLTVGDSPLPKEVIDAIMEEHGKAVQKGRLWQEKYEQAVQNHAQALQQMAFSHRVDKAIAKLGGRSVKAICALLDMEALGQDTREDAVEQALLQLRQDQGYLFEQAPTSPPYAANTGAQVQQPAAPATLAGALRERFENRR